MVSVCVLWYLCIVFLFTSYLQAMNSTSVNSPEREELTDKLARRCIDYNRTTPEMLETAKKYGSRNELLN